MAVVASPARAPALLVLEGVTKVFPNGTRALRGVELVTQSGTIHGLVGANGAGKSTLIKIISGATAPTAGVIRWQGQGRQWRGPGESLHAGIATVYQDAPLVPTLSVLENVYLGSRQGWRWRARAKAADLARMFDAVGYELPPDRLVSDLAIGDRQLVAILQAFSQQPALLILDEPTASLSVSERNVIHLALRRLRAGGTGIVFVSHLLDEIMSLTDTVTVLRDGTVTLSEPTPDLAHDRLVGAIVGRELQGVEAHGRAAKPAVRDARRPLFEVQDITSPGKAREVNFTVAAGEVIGLAGLLGSGRSEILHAIFGSDRDARGTVYVSGEAIARHPAAAVRAGVALVPEDRLKQGLVPGWEIWRNVTLPRLSEHSRWGIFPRRSAEIAAARDAIEKLSIRAPSPDALVDELSGGNAQKTVFGKWLNAGIKVLLLDEPTAGIDIGAKRDIHLLIRGLSGRGVAVIIVDSEFDELLAIADRVLIVRRGEVVAERVAGATTAMELLTLASGLGSPEYENVDGWHARLEA